MWRFSTVLKPWRIAQVIRAPLSVMACVKLLGTSDTSDECGISGVEDAMSSVAPGKGGLPSRRPGTTTADASHTSSLTRTGRTERGEGWVSALTLSVWEEESPHTHKICPFLFVGRPCLLGSNSSETVRAVDRERARVSSFHSSVHRARRRPPPPAV